MVLVLNLDCYSGFPSGIQLSAPASIFPLQSAFNLLDNRHLEGYQRSHCHWKVINLHWRYFLFSRSGQRLVVWYMFFDHEDPKSRPGIHGNEPISTAGPIEACRNLRLRLGVHQRKRIAPINPHFSFPIFTPSMENRPTGGLFIS